MGEQKRKGKKNRYRSKGLKPVVTTTIIIGSIIVIGIADYISRSNSSPLKIYDVSRSKGSAEAPLQIIEFMDFQCHECARGAPLLAQYIADYPDGIFLTIKYFPLGDLNSMISARYGECAARQDKFWSMHDLLFARQDQWRALQKAKPYLDIIAKDAGMDINDLERCLADPVVRQVIDSERMLGESHFVKSTPTYFINDEIIVGVEALRSALEDYFQ